MVSGNGYRAALLFSPLSPWPSTQPTSPPLLPLSVLEHQMSIERSENGLTPPLLAHSYKWILSPPIMETLAITPHFPRPSTVSPPLGASSSTSQLPYPTQPIRGPPGPVHRRFPAAPTALCPRPREEAELLSPSSAATCLQATGVATGNHI